MDDLKFPFEIIESCYQSTIYNQQISYRLLQESMIINESNDSVFSNIKEWVTTQVARLGEILKKWADSIINFFSKTIPNFFAPILKKIREIVKRLFKNKKKINTPKEASKEQKDIIKKTVEDSNNIVKETIFNRELIDAQEKIKDISNKIYSIEDENVRQEIINAIKEKSIIIIDGQKEDEVLSVTCKDIYDKLKITLSTILEACENRQEMLKSLSVQLIDIMDNPISKKSFEKAKNIDFTGDLSEEDKKNLEAYMSINFIKTINYNLKRGKFYTMKKLERQPEISIKIKDIQKYLEDLNTDKNKDGIINSVNRQVNLIKELSDKLVSTCKNQRNVESLLKYISSIQNVSVTYLTDASKYYGELISYGVETFINALKNNKTDLEEKTNGSYQCNI